MNNDNGKVLKKFEAAQLLESIPENQENEINDVSQNSENIYQHDSGNKPITQQTMANLNKSIERRMT